MGMGGANTNAQAAQPTVTRGGTGSAPVPNANPMQSAATGGKGGGQPMSSNSLQELLQKQQREMDPRIAAMRQEMVNPRRGPYNQAIAQGRPDLAYAMRTGPNPQNGAQQTDPQRLMQAYQDMLRGQNTAQNPSAAPNTPQTVPGVAGLANLANLGNMFR